jgi:RimJ/RimL family protein N-acetyltransferase
MSLYKAPQSYYKISTDRFYFRKVEKSDVDLWVPFFNNNPNLHFLGIDVDIPDEEHAASWIENQLNRYNREGFGHLAVIDKKSNELVGMSGIIKRVVGGEDFLEIAYSVMPHHWGKGYASEMSHALLSFGREQQLAKQFISIIHPENKASIKVAQKNGMRFLRTDVYSDIPVNIYSVSVTLV